MSRDSFLPAYVDVRPVSANGYWFTLADLNWYLKVMPWVKVIGGHTVVPFSGLDGYHNVKYFTVFREPVARYISQYRYWRSALGINITFEDFLEKSGSWNMQAKKITKDRKAVSAIKTLQEKFIAYGVVEDLELFIADLASHFQCEMTLQRKNFTENKVDRVDELREKYLQAIIERNEEDIEIYSWVKQSNELRVKQMSKTIQEQKGNTQAMLIDYVYRKSYCEPVSGVKRILNGMPYKGSYGL